MNTKVERNNKLIWLIIQISSKPKVLMTICFIIILTGLFLSKYTSYTTAFPRSGAILVAVAILSVYLNHYIISDLQNINNISTPLEKINQNDLIQNIQRTNPKMSKYEAIIAAFQTLEFKNKIQERIPKLQTSKQNIIHLEFLSGIIGTLIWGFGDLFFS